MAENPFRKRWSELTREGSREGEISEDQLRSLSHSFDDFLDRNVEEIEKTKDHQVALDQLTELSTLTNAAARKQPRILARLGAQTSKLQGAAADLVARVGAEGFTISVGFSRGVSVSFTFKANRSSDRFQRRQKLGRRISGWRYSS